MEEKMEEKVEEKVEAKKEHKRYRLREDYTCIDRQVSLQKSDTVEALDDQLEKNWLVRHCVDKQKVLTTQPCFLRLSTTSYYCLFFTFIYLITCNLLSYILFIFLAHGTQFPMAKILNKKK